MMELECRIYIDGKLDRQGTALIDDAGDRDPLPKVKEDDEPEAQ